MAKSMPLIVYVRMGSVERGRDYHWADGYSRDGNTQPWVTKREAQAEAKKEGGRRLSPRPAWAYHQSPHDVK